MGCCNKTPDGRPIRRARYYGGLALLAGVQLGGLGALCALAVPVPRVRRLLPFYFEFTRRTMDSVRRRERISVGGRPLDDCPLPEAP
jgi:hypothetical protein